MLSRSSNPTLKDSLFTRAAFAGTNTETMTISSTVNKIAIMLLLVIMGAVFTWSKFYGAPAIEEGVSTVMPWMIGGLIGGLITAIIIMFAKTKAYIFAPIYSVLQGLFIGGISAIFEASYGGIVIQAVALTFGTLFALLAAYKSRIIKVTDNFRLGIVAATGGIFLFYIVVFILSLFGVSTAFVSGTSWLSIGISLVIVVIAALNLVLDFDFIERAAEQGAPKYMEWFAAFGLMVTLIWLYIEILNLLAKLAGRSND